MSCEEHDFCTSTGQDFEILFNHLETAGGAVVPVTGDVYALAIMKNGSVVADLAISTNAAPPNGSTATLDIPTGEIRFIVSAAAITILGHGIYTYAVQWDSFGAKDIVLQGGLVIEQGPFA